MADASAGAASTLCERALAVRASLCALNTLFSVVALVIEGNSTAGASTAAAAAAPSSSKIALLRCAPGARTVWEWTPPAGAGTKLKALVWSPQGTLLAVLTNSHLVLLELNNGTPAIPPLPLPSSLDLSALPPSALSWQALPRDALGHTRARSHMRELIDTLPALAPIDKTPVGPGNAGDGTDSVAGGGAARGGRGGFGGLRGRGAFGGAARAAMLAKERDKEATRPLEFAKLAAEVHLPVLAPTSSAQQGEQSSNSLLFVGNYAWLDGSIYIGRLRSPRSHSLVIPRAPPLQLASVASGSLCALSSPQVPRTLVLLVRSISRLRNYLQHACDALHESRVAFDEARRVAKAWLSRVAELGRGAGWKKTDMPPVTMLLRLLATGAPGRAVYDYLASPLSTRAFARVESTHVRAYARLSALSLRHLEPALERATLLLDELAAWSRWRQLFGSFGLEEQELDKAIKLIVAVLTRAADLERRALEERAGFDEFLIWFKYETAKVAYEENNSEGNLPPANFYPQLVSSYLRLSSTFYGVATPTGWTPSPSAHELQKGSLAPLLDLGSAASPLEAHADIKRLREWWDSASASKRASRHEATPEEHSAQLEQLRARLEELKASLPKARADAIARTQAERERRRQAEMALHHHHKIIVDSGPTLDVSIDEDVKPDIKIEEEDDESHAASDKENEDGDDDNAGVPIRGDVTAPQKAVDPLGWDYIDPALDDVRSMPALLHMVVEKLGGLLSRSLVTTLGEAEEDGKAQELGDGARERVSVDAAGRAVLWATRPLDDQTYEIQRTELGANNDAQRVAVPLRMQGVDAVAIVDHAFLGDTEVIVLIRATLPRGVIRHTLGVVDLQAVAQTPTELTLKTHRTLDPHVVPCGLVIDSADGRRLACVLESEGRRLEVIDLAALT